MFEEKEAVPALPVPIADNSIAAITEADLNVLLALCVRVPPLCDEVNWALQYAILRVRLGRHVGSPNMLRGLPLGSCLG